MAELVDEPLTPLGFLHNSLLVVLSDAPGQLVVVHGGPVLSLSPQPGDTHWILNLEHAVTCRTRFELNICWIKRIRDFLFFERHLTIIFIWILYKSHILRVDRSLKVLEILKVCTWIEGFAFFYKLNKTNKITNEMYDAFKSHATAMLSVCRAMSSWPDLIWYKFNFR